MNGIAIPRKIISNNLHANRLQGTKANNCLNIGKLNCCLLILLLMGGISVIAQDNTCNNRTIQQAMTYYDKGEFNQTLSLIKGCLKSFKTDTIKFEAYKVLSITYIATDSIAQAAESVKEMLRFRPFYIPDTYASYTFKKMVAYTQQIKTTINAFDNLVTSASSTRELSSEAPASIYVVTNEQMQRRGYRFLLDLLNDIPEIEIQKNSIVEFKNQVSFRGISGNEKFLIMMDGIRLTPSTGDFYTLGENFSLVNAKQVEVILGPASALYGVDAFSGIINIISKNGEQLQNVDLQVDFGNYNSFNSSIIAGNKQSNFSWMVSGQYFSTDEANYADLYKDDFRWYHEKYVPLGEVTFTDGISRAINVDRAKTKFEMPTRAYFLNGKVNFGNFEVGGVLHGEKHSASLSVDPEFTIYSSDAFLSSNFQGFYAKHSFRPSKSRWSLFSQVSSNYYTLSPKSRFVNKFTSYKRGFKYQFSKSVKFEERFRYDISPRAQFILGLSYENLSALPKTADLSKKYDRNLPADNQNLTYPGSRTISSQGDTTYIWQNFYELNYQNYGSLIQWMYNPNEHINITVGGRFDYNTRYGGTFNPRIGIVYKPKKQLNIKLLYGQSFLAPSPWKAYSHFGTFQKQLDPDNNEVLSSNFFHVPNPELKPEKLNAYEVSTSYYLNDNLVFAVNGYYNIITDLINFQAVSGEGSFQGIPVATIEQAKNEGKANVYGGSITARYIRTYSSILKFDGYFNYSFNNGKIGDENITLSARHQIKCGVDARFKQFNVSLRWNYRTESLSVVKNENGKYIANDPFGIVNFYLSYDLTPVKNLGVNLFIRVDNLTNNKHYHVGVGNDSFARTPQQPLSFNTGIKLVFN